MSSTEQEDLSSAFGANLDKVRGSFKMLEELFLINKISDVDAIFTMIYGLIVFIGSQNGTKQEAMELVSFISELLKSQISSLNRFSKNVS